MIFGFDVTDPKLSCCLAKGWEEFSTGTAFILTVFGTEPDRNLIFSDGLTATLENAVRTLQLQLEEISASEGAADLVYAATKIAACCNLIHRRTRETSEALGQGIYLAGAILYFTPDKYMILPFGSAVCYAFQDDQLTPQGTPPDTAFIRDALGGTAHWTPQIWQGTRYPHTRLLLASRQPADLAACSTIVRELGDDCNHPNTISMLLRREIEKQSPGYPTAVAEIHF